jgi:ATP-binding protein involved in chromosome partitioning
LPEKATTDGNGDWSVTLNLFKQGGGEAAAIEFEVPFLGALPFDPGVVRGGDDGVHRIVAEPEGETAQAFDTIVGNLLAELDKGEDEAPEII